MNVRLLVNTPPGVVTCTRPVVAIILFNGTLAAWHLPSEPWVFAIDRRGRIAARLEGAASAAEVRAAAERALR